MLNYHLFTGRFVLCFKAPIVTNKISCQASILQRTVITMSYTKFVAGWEAEPTKGKWWSAYLSLLLPLFRWKTYVLKR